MMAKRTLWWMGVLFLVVAMWPTTGRTADAVLYEVTESVQLKDIAKFRSSVATLSGTVRSGTSLCPASVDPVACTVVVRAKGSADDTTGTGPVSGTFDGVIQDQNGVDGAELVVMRGQISGTIDLSPAFLQRMPWGFITGQFKGSGASGTRFGSLTADGTFRGTFRLPFLVNEVPSYLMNDGSVVPLTIAEYTLGQPTGRLELNFFDRRTR